MSGEDEDLDVNPFFKYLKRVQASYWTRAEANCYMICIPQSRACKGLELTKDVVETHILQPSKLFQDQYTTLNNKSLRFNGKNIITGEGFEAKRTVTILHEEVFFNKQRKSFKVFCLDRPLEGGSAALGGYEDNILPKHIDFKESAEFLWAYPENEIVMKKIDRQLREFIESYAIVPGYLSHVVRKVQLLNEQAATDLICANPSFRRIHNNNWRLDDLHLIIECYVMGKLYQKIFPPIAQMYALEDQWFSSLMERGYLLTQEKFGVRNDLRIPMLEGISKLSLLSDFQTPYEKLLCIRDTLNITTEAFLRKYSKEDEEPNPITTDDLIPILAYMIVQARVECLKSNLAFIENFLFSNIKTTELGFNFVSFQAAVGYICSEEISSIAGIPPLKTKEPGSQSSLPRTSIPIGTDSGTNNHFQRSTSPVDYSSADSPPLDSTSSPPSSFSSSSSSAITSSSSSSSSVAPPNLEEMPMFWRSSRGSLSRDSSFSSSSSSSFSLLPSSLQSPFSSSSSSSPPSSTTTSSSSSGFSRSLTSGSGSSSSSGSGFSSTSSGGSSIYQPPPGVIKLEDEEELGDFLGQLKRNRLASLSKERQDLILTINLN